MKHKSAGYPQNSIPSILNPHSLSSSPERQALDSLIEISNQCDPQGEDLKLLNTEESEIIHLQSTVLEQSPFWGRSKPRPQSPHGSHLRSQSSQNRKRKVCLEQRLTLSFVKRRSTPEPSMQSLEQQIVSNTVFIRKVSPTRKLCVMPPQCSNIVYPMGNPMLLSSGFERRLNNLFSLNSSLHEGNSGDNHHNYSHNLNSVRNNGKNASKEVLSSRRHSRIQFRSHKNKLPVAAPSKHNEARGRKRPPVLRLELSMVASIRGVFY